MIAVLYAMDRRRHDPVITTVDQGGIPFKVMRSLAAVMVPAHGFVSGAVGLSHSSSGSMFRSARSQIWTFTKQLLRSCAIAAAIGAGLLVYTRFVARWKETGLPTIPISALVVADQAAGASRQTAIPLAGSSTYSPSGRRDAQGAPSRQTSLLDLDEYEG